MGEWRMKVVDYDTMKEFEKDFQEKENKLKTIEKSEISDIKHYLGEEDTTKKR